MGIGGATKLNGQDTQSLKKFSALGKYWEDRFFDSIHNATTNLTKTEKAAFAKPGKKARQAKSAHARLPQMRKVLVASNK